MFIVNINGNNQDGTISEIGFVAGYNERETLSMKYQEIKLTKEYEEEFGRKLFGIPIIAYTSNARLLQPQFSDGIPSASANHLVKGMVDVWGEFVGDEQSLYERLKEIY